MVNVEYTIHNMSGFRTDLTAGHILEDLTTRNRPSLEIAVGHCGHSTLTLLIQLRSI